ncbi:MAG: hypothetical protein AAGI46_00265 [Planctomycetota bacterium]
MTKDEVSSRLKSCICDFMEMSGHPVPDLDDDVDLLHTTEASSDEGVDLALEISEALGSDVPHDFNPLVHPNGKRGMKFGELVRFAQKWVAPATEGV